MGCDMVWEELEYAGEGGGRNRKEGRRQAEQTVTNQSRSDQFLARKGLTIMTRPEGPSSASATMGRVPWLELGSGHTSYVSSNGSDL